MFSEISLHGFRGFRDFKMQNLGRVNLLVGTNNCGKTSVLEAVNVLASGGDLASLWLAMLSRGERSVLNGDARGSQEADICHLFHGHEIYEGVNLRIVGVSESQSGSLKLSITNEDEAEDSTGNLGMFEGLEDEVATEHHLLAEWMSTNGTTNGTIMAMPLTPRGGLQTRHLRHWSAALDEEKKPVSHISTSAMSVDQVVESFDAIVLTEEEELLLEALRTIDPNIDRLASVGVGRNSSFSVSEKGGIVVRLKNVSQRVPIGSMGDGIWRMLGMALALVSSQHGVVLIDEIDTGLHYSVMADMWKFVRETAQRLDVQVFATTHSRDCYESLAAIARDDVSAGSEVSIQRIEPNSPQAISFTEQEIVAAADRGIEVR